MGSENTVSLDEIAEAQARLLQLATGFWSARALHVALALDVFGRLEQGAVPAAALAQAINADGAGMEALLGALCALGLVEKGPRGFANTALASLFLVPSAPQYQGHLFLGYAAEWPKWQQLESVLKHGPATTVARKGFSSEAAQARTAQASVIAPFLARKLDLRRVRKMLDLSGASGLFAIECARSKPDLAAVVLDQEGAMASINERVAAATLGDRITTKVGDITDAVLGASEYDLIVVSDVVRTQPTARSRELLEHCFEAVVGEGMCVVCDVLLNDDRQGPLLSTLFALENLIANPAGPACSTWDITDMMQGVGFIRLQTLPLGNATHGLVVGYHP